MKTKRKTAKSASVTEGSGNVFADLGLPNADQELMKARLTLQIYRIIKERGITQTEAGKILGIPRLRIVVRLLFLIIAIVCLSEKDRTRRKPES